MVFCPVVATYNKKKGRRLSCIIFCKILFKCCHYQVKGNREQRNGARAVNSALFPVPLSLFLLLWVNVCFFTCSINLAHIFYFCFCMYFFSFSIKTRLILFCSLILRSWFSSLVKLFQAILCFKFFFLWCAYVFTTPTGYPSEHQGALTLFCIFCLYYVSHCMYIFCRFWSVCVALYVIWFICVGLCLVRSFFATIKTPTKSERVFLLLFFFSWFFGLCFAPIK